MDPKNILQKEQMLTKGSDSQKQPLNRLGTQCGQTETSSFQASIYLSPKVAVRSCVIGPRWGIHTAACLWALTVPVLGTRHSGEVDF